MIASSTQQFIEIAGVQDGVIVLKNGSYRMIFSVSAMNFSLKSEEEQNSLIFQYQSFLNSLHFPIQIVMRSKRLDLNPYLKKIDEIKNKQENELIRLQTEDYMDFVTELINLSNIMKKTFYVVVGYDPITVKKGSILDKIFPKNEATNLKISDQEFKRYKDEITERANVVATGLGAMSLHCVQLSTEEIIELFYKIYNPEIADKERFTDVDELTSSFIADIHEKKASDTVKEDAKNEAVIDNSAVVEEQYKKQSQLAEREMAKDAEKQIAGAPTEKLATSPASTTPVNSQAQPSTATTPQSPPANAPAATGTPEGTPAPASNPIPAQNNQPAPTPPPTSPPVSQ